jgi:hypothetical protein
MDHDTRRALDPEVRQFVEDMGLLYEGEGLPPMAGRLVGWLLLCDPPHQTAGELAEVLGASSGSISTMTRLLVQFGIIERIAVPGLRSAAYRMLCHGGPEHLERILEKMIGRRELFERGLDLLADRPPPVRERLREQLEFARFIEREVPVLIERWKRERSA